MSRRDRAQVFSLVVYLAAAVAIGWRLLRLPAERLTQVPTVVAVVIVFAAIAIAAQVRYLFSASASRRQALAAAISHGASFGICILYLGFVRWHQIPFFVVGLYALLIPATFLVTAAYVIFRRKETYLITLVATPLIWPYLAQVILSSDDLVNRVYPRVKIQGLVFLLSPFLYVAAAAMARSRARASHLFASLAAALAWTYLGGVELSYRNSFPGNLWNMLNVPDSPYSWEVTDYVRLTILAIIFLLLATLNAAIRLCPEKWSFRGSPVRDKTWLVIVCSFVLTATWFCSSAMPYTAPRYGRGDLSVLRVEKHGFHFLETRIALQRDRRYFLEQEERRPFHYRANGFIDSSVLDRDSFERIWSFAQSPAFRNARTSRHSSPREWNSETWYVYGQFHTRPLIFSGVDGTAPPQEILDWFHLVESLPRQDVTKSRASKDVCLGFCYDPLGQ